MVKTLENRVAKGVGILRRTLLEASKDRIDAVRESSKFDDDMYECLGQVSRESMEAGVISRAELNYVRFCMGNNLDEFNRSESVRGIAVRVALAMFLTRLLELKFERNGMAAIVAAALNESSC